MLLHYKQWTQDKGWLPATYDQQHKVFISDVNGSMKLPPGMPALREPTYERQNLDMVQRTINSGAHHLDSDQHDWWSSFFNNPTDGIPDSVWAPDILKQHAADISEDEEMAVVAGPTVLTPFLERERRAPHVSTQIVIEDSCRNVQTFCLLYVRIQTDTVELIYVC